MINRATIGKAVEKLLRDKTDKYTIVRNEPRNEDPNVAAEGGWIGIYRANVVYRKLTTGPTPWLAEVDILIEIQVASMNEGEDVEDQLQAAEEEIIKIVSDDRNLGGTVSHIKEIAIDDELNANASTNHQSVLITVKAEARA